MSMKRVTILGATGSIGVQTLTVLQHHPDRFDVFAITAYQNATLLFEQCQAYHPEVAVCVDPVAADTVRTRLAAVGSKTTVLSGEAALLTVAAESTVDIVVAAVVGAAGLPATLAAVEAGKRVLLANKEALIMSGTLFMSAVQRANATLLPVDSEHNALLQCLPSDYLPGMGRPAGVEKLVLTASGGPFRQRALETLSAVTPEEAVAHPNWSMGAKISVDSATMMNKGLEVIEAHYLFDMPSEAIEVVIHPESIVHSLVAMIDGAVLAELGMPDMRCPISYCLSWPKRMPAPVAKLDLLAAGKLTFEAPDLSRFPCLRLAYQAMAAGQGAICAMNAANEVAVSAFLSGHAAYLQIPETIDYVLNEIDGVDPKTLPEVLAIDQQARAIAAAFLKVTV